jgi:hypothetical protein
MDTVGCPECGELAEVTERFVLESTDGPIEHARIGCVRRHWFLLPVGRLGSVTDPVGPPLRSGQWRAHVNASSTGSG